MLIFLSFVIPVILWTIGIMLCGIFPFGDKILLFGDLLYQYTDFYEFYQRILLGEADLFYSFFNGIGGETLGIVAYYLMSPFNFILAFFKPENISEAVLVINLLKIGACGATFCVFLNKKFRQKGWINIAFSTCYALMSYNIAYQVNLMWIDGVIWLPIIALGIERLFEKNKMELLYISLTIAIISNWYIAFILCIFTGIYTIYIMYPDMKNNYKKFLKVILTGILAAGTASVVIVPAIYSQMQSFSRTVLIKNSPINFALFDILSKLITGAFSFSEITSSYSSKEFHNLPNIYCSCFVTFMAILYFINSKIEKREKEKNFFVLAFLLISCVFYLINVGWHIFSPNIWYPYRWSFVISFFMILIAYNGYSLVEQIESKRIVKVFGFIAAVCFIIEKMQYSYLTSGNIYITLFILFAYIILLEKFKNKRIYLPIIIFIICLDIFANTYLMFANMPYTSRDELYTANSTLLEAIDEIEDKDYRFYRIENDLDNVGANFGLANGILGVSSATSTLNDNKRTLLSNIGVNAKAVTYSEYTHSTDFSDDFLGIKYFISKNEKNETFVEKNTDALSLGFMVNEKIMEIKNFCKDEKFHKNPLQNGNLIIKKMTNTNQDVFKEIKISNIRYENMKRVRDTELFIKDIKNKEMTCKFSFLPVKDKKTYLNIYSTDLVNAEVTVNGKILPDDDRENTDFLIELGTFDSKENVNIEIKVFDKENIAMSDIYVCYFDDILYGDFIENLGKKQLRIENITDSKLNGKINVESDKNMLLMTIVYDDFLRAKVDGIEVTPEKVLDSLTGIKLLPGEHFIEIWYDPIQLKIGTALSALFLVISASIIGFRKRKNRIAHEIIKDN